MTQEVKKRPDKFASDGAENWIDLLRNTAILEAGGKITKSQSTYFPAPEEDKQGDFFRTPILEVAYKDDMSLMDFNPFGLGKKPRFEPIEYKLNDSLVTVSGSNKHGIATIYDYDIVIFMMSHLAQQMNDVKRRIEAGEENPPLPNRKMHVYASDMFDAFGEEQGGRQMKSLEARLQRLTGTMVEIKEKKKSTRRKSGGFPLIGGFQIVKNTKTKQISEFYIDIPAWIYDGIVRPAQPTVLSLAGDYFQIRSGLHKFISRMAKKSAGRTEWHWPIETLHERSGSTQPLADFKRDMKKAIDKLKSDPLQDYEVWYVEGEAVRRRRPMEVYFKNRLLPAEAQEGAN